jgi:surface antigen
MQAATVTEVAELRKTLPPMVDAGAAAINNASSAVRVIEPHIPSVLTEVKKTREALPGILDRADQVAGRAEKMGKEASKGAVTGLLGGIISAPFRLIGDVGKGLRDTIGLGNLSEFTAEDDRLTGGATDAVLRNGATGAQQSWQNPDSGNHGSVTLLGHKTLNNQPCVNLRYRVEFGTGKTHDVKLDFCQRPDGSWAKP